MIQISPTVAQVKAWLISLFPPGADNMYSRAEGDGGTGDYLGAIADGVQANGTDLITTLRTEINPSSAVGKLPEWEDTLGLSSTTVAQSGTTADRQAQVVARLRAWGASTLDNIRAAVQPFFQYVDSSLIQIIECDRSALTTLHTYAFSSGVIPAGGTLDTYAVVTDGVRVSGGGAHVWAVITHAAIQQLRVTLYDAGTATFWTLATPGDLGTGAAVAQTFEFFVKDTEGETSLAGSWLLSVQDTGATAGTLDAGSQLFIEGIGRDPLDPFGPVQGLGYEQFLFAVVFDPSLSNVSTPNLAAARLALRKVTPAHCQGYIVQVMSGGGLCAIVDDAAALVDGCTVC